MFKIVIFKRSNSQEQNFVKCNINSKKYYFQMIILNRSTKLQVNYLSFFVGGGVSTLLFDGGVMLIHSTLDIKRFEV